MMNPDPTGPLLARLEQGGFGPRSTGPDAWESRCPAHEGGRHNLSIKRGEDGRILIHCHHAPGCEPETIMAALGMTTADLFPNNTARSGAARKRKVRRPMSEPGAPPRENALADRPKPALHAHRAPELALTSVINKYGKPSAHWIYCDADGYESFYVYRFDFINDKGKDDKTYRPVHTTPEGWVSGDPPGPLPLYRLPDLAPASCVFVTEGEKASDRARDLGVAATTSSHGAKSPHKTDWSPLAGKDVVILPDHDDEGGGYAAAVSAILARLDPRPSVKIVKLTDLWKTSAAIPEGADIVEWLSDGAPEQWSESDCRDELERQAAAASEVDLDQAASQSSAYANGNGNGRHPPGTSSNGKTVDEPRVTQSQTLIRIAERAELWHTADGDAYASLPVKDHTEHHAIRSPAFRRWLHYAFFVESGKPPSCEAMTVALATTEARACIEGLEDSMQIRVGSYGDAYYLDLCDPERRAGEITKDGWNIVTRCPVRFHRAKGLRALPIPVRGASLDLFQNYVTPRDDDYLLLVAWLTAAFRPRGPYPILVLIGEQGSAKTTLARALRALCDPHESPLRFEPREPRELMISARNSWVIAIDNISALPPWLSDGFCRLATGGGFAMRTLYTDTEETFINVQRPIVLNGIVDYVTRGDLIDRSLFVHLPRIAEEDRQTEAAFWQSFTADSPMILGAILDAVAGAMKWLPEVKPTTLPRMADFAVWGQAVSLALGWNPERFTAAYEANRRDAQESILEDSLLAGPLIQIVERNPLWEGTAARLLDELNEGVDEKTTKAKGWPKSPRGLSGMLRRLAPTLRMVGVDVVFPDRRKGERPLELHKLPDKGRIVPSPPSPPSPDRETQGK